MAWYPTLMNNRVELVTFADGTDEQMAAMLAAHYAGELDLSQYWSVGDIRTIHLSAMSATGVGESHREQDVEIVILDFNHDDLTESIGSITKAAVTIQLKDCLRDASVTDTTGSSNTERGYMNSTNTNVGGWKSCARRTWCNGTFFNALPSYLQTLIKPVNKPVTVGNQSSAFENPPVSDSVFLLSEQEIFGFKSYAAAEEGTKYAYFKLAKENRYKLPKWDSSSVSDYWWERSPYGSNSTDFCHAGRGYDGSAYVYSASYAFGLAPAFCL